MRRLTQILPVILLATFLVFGLVQLVPGDPAVTLAGDNASVARIAEIRHLYGLDRPFLLQYGNWLWHAVHGDLSRSLLTNVPVLNTIAQNLPNTLLLVVLAFGGWNGWAWVEGGVLEGWVPEGVGRMVRA